MAALDRLFDDDQRFAGSNPARVPAHGKPATVGGTGESRSPAGLLPLLPLLQPVDEPRPEQRPSRHLFLNELDGPDYDDAVAAADRFARERDDALHGVDVRIGWTKDAA